MRTSDEQHIDTTDDSTWEKRYARKVSQEELRQIKENLTGFFDLLAKWDRQKREADGKEVQP